ncbi:MAG: phosphate/phosphite/phosphonate ABC transporter substrate-binding protein [Caldimonas sp.]
MAGLLRSACAPALRRSIAVLALGAALDNSAAAAGPALSFGVVPQRTATLTAQYWNPILNHVSTRSGVAIELRLARSGPEHAALVGNGSFDLAYTNHHLRPGNEGAGYRAFARPSGAPIRGEIVVLEPSPIRSLAELQGKEVGFPSRVAFFGYQVPMDALARAGIQVLPVFGGTQEGILGQLRAGRVAAASVNSQVMRDFAEREKFAYRTVWRSEAFHNIPLIAHPRVPSATVAAVLGALLAMAADPEGSKILATGAELLKLDPPLGFVAANDSDYDNARAFLRASMLRSEGR